MSDLFNQSIKRPLAYDLRPEDLSHFVGQNHLTGPQKLISEIIKNNTSPSLILWGPTGSGKTTLAYIIAKSYPGPFKDLSALETGTKEVKEILKEAQDHLHFHNQSTLVFIDEIHRFNKAQQDILLKAMEKGIISLIGATTENPSFEVNQAILSRSQVITLKALTYDDLEQILTQALSSENLSKRDLNFAPDAKELLLHYADGDARKLLNTLELCLSLLNPEEKMITKDHLSHCLQEKTLQYDKKGEDYYNLISAFIKSMRGTDPDAALYYLARLLKSGADPIYIARRMVIFASEDIGNADPQALQIALNAKSAFEFIGPAEGWIPFAQAVTYLATAPKSNASYSAYKKASQVIHETGNLKIPLHLRNAPTKLLKDLGYKKGYQYAHGSEDQLIDHHHLPKEIQDKIFYEPQGIGYEKKFKERLEQAQKKRKNHLP